MATQDLHSDAEKVAFLQGEIGEARASFRYLRNHIEFGTDRDSETISWILGHLNALYLPKFELDTSSESG